MIAVLILTVGLGADLAADSVTLRDGKVILGQLVEDAPRGRIALIVRREWAKEAVPDRLKAWEAAEAPWIKKARADRLQRLKAWKADKPARAVATWIDAETEKLEKGPELPPLLIATIGRGDVRKIDRRPPEVARKLRQGWLAGFSDAETRPVGELTSALEGRGFPMTGDDPALVEDLLPIPVETEGRWRARRAATEVAQEPSLRFLRYGNFLMPEGTPGEPVDPSKLLGGLAKSMLGGLGDLGGLGGLGDLAGGNDGPAANPLDAKSAEVAARGRVGFLVTYLETAEDLSGVTVEITLFGRLPNDRWETATTKTVQVRTDDVEPGEGGNIGNDPQVKSVFGTIEGLGLDLPDDLKQKALRIGAATQKALGMARTAIQPDLDELRLPIDAPQGP